MDLSLYPELKMKHEHESINGQTQLQYCIGSFFMEDLLDNCLMFFVQ